jgi:type II restriction enzyme
MIRRIQSNNNPNFFLLNYSLVDMIVRDFAVIPRHFFVPDIIIRRKPLAVTARRAGWVGCNISIKRIPEAGKIFIVRDGRLEDREIVLKSWKQTAFLSDTRVASRGWTVEMISVLERLPEKFVLADVYGFEDELKKRFPLNRFVRDKIRQQLQVLGDHGLLIFEGKGRYRKATL